MVLFSECCTTHFSQLKHQTDKHNNSLSQRWKLLLLELLHLSHPTLSIGCICLEKEQVKMVLLDVFKTTRINHIEDLEHTIILVLSSTRMHWDQFHSISMHLINRPGADKI